MSEGNERYEAMKRCLEDPDCYGIYLSKGRTGRGPYEDLGFQCYAFAVTLMSGGNVGIQSLKEDPVLIEKIQWYLTNIYSLETEVETIYTKGTYDSQDAGRFIGYSITLKNQSNERVIIGANVPPSSQ